jgi:hypothetical protein
MKAIQQTLKDRELRAKQLEEEQMKKQEQLDEERLKRVQQWEAERGMMFAFVCSLFLGCNDRIHSGGESVGRIR